MSANMTKPPVEKSNRSAASLAGRSFDVAKVRADFPILSTQSRGHPLIYLDNGATTQKPRQVIETIDRYYKTQNANIHRGVYELSQLATDLYENARKKIQTFLNARESAEIIFTRGTTEGINLVASSLGRSILKRGDEIIVSTLEHHSNIVPWQIIAEQTGASVKAVALNDRGELEMDAFASMLSPRTKIVAVSHLSNALGTINDAKRITEMAHAVGAKVLIDGAQWVAHFPTDVQHIGCDFYVFSGHKIYGPTGIGVLYGRRELLDTMPPYQGGGDMIESVSFTKTTYAPLPNKFEAGTPNIAGAVGLGAAIDYVSSLNFTFVDHEQALLEYATRQLSEIPGLKIIGTAAHKGSVISFIFENPSVSPLDIGMKLDVEGIAVRTGHHCCQPVMDLYCIPGTTRASLAMYNIKEDVDALVEALKRLRNITDTPKQAPKPATQSAMQWPKASARSPKAAADELAEVFELLDDREAKNEYVLELGAKLPHTFELLKKVTTRIPGCMSEVYLLGRPAAEDATRIEIIADANAEIVRGLIAMMEKLYSGQRAKDVLDFEIEDFFRRIGLDQFISSQRRNGLAGMIAKIRSRATEITKTAKATPAAT